MRKQAVSMSATSLSEPDPDDPGDDQGCTTRHGGRVPLEHAALERLEDPAENEDAGDASDECSIDDHPVEEVADLASSQVGKRKRAL